MSKACECFPPRLLNHGETESFRDCNSFLESYSILRNITGVGKGPIVGLTANEQLGFFPGSDRIVQDAHPYLIFGEPKNDPFSFVAAAPVSILSQLLIFLTINPSA
jgi:hypothetical protein